MTGIQWRSAGACCSYRLNTTLHDTRPWRGEGDIPQRTTTLQPSQGPCPAWQCGRPSPILTPGTPQTILRQLGHTHQRQGVNSVTHPLPLACKCSALHRFPLPHFPIPPPTQKKRTGHRPSLPSPPDPPARPAPRQGYSPGAAAPAPAPASGCAARTGAAGRSSCRAARATWGHIQGSGGRGVCVGGVACGSGKREGGGSG